MYYIYKHTINGLPYIGQTVNPTTHSGRFNRSKYKTDPKVYAAMMKYGVNFKETVILETTDTLEKALDIEAKYIKLYDSVNNGWNISEYGSKNKAFTGKKHTAATKALQSKNNHKNHRVICIETNKEYNSCAEASRDTGIPASTIVRSASTAGTRSKQFKNSLHWKYID